jgi:hypothetical protein
VASVIFGLGYADELSVSAGYPLSTSASAEWSASTGGVTLQIHTRSTIGGTANIKEAGYWYQ